MKQILCIIFTLLAISCTQLYAQNITNTTWKTFVGEPMNDTIILKFRTDSAFLTTSKGDIINSYIKVLKDTLNIRDISGQYACPETLEGKYTYSIDSNVLTIKLLNDECNGRNMLTTIKFINASHGPAKK